MAETAPDPSVASIVANAHRRASKRHALFMAWIVAGFLFFSLTSPKSVPSVLLVVGFFIIGTILYVGLSMVLSLIGLGQRLSATSRAGLLVTVSVLPVLLLMLQSIGQLSVRDILTLGCLFFIGMFYVSRVVSPVAKRN